ncbi:MAG: trypsin-like serine peptidase [Methylococcales bacterium]
METIDMIYLLYNRSLYAAAAALLVAFAGTAVAVDDRHQIVSSDGAVIESAASGAIHGVSGSAGYRPIGVRRDVEAEFPASRLTPDEMAEMARTYVPIVPPYASAEAARETVIGSDARYRILPKASGYPERAIGLLIFNQGDSSFICTGWLINANTVATAGHCVHQGNGGSFSSNVVFYPGRDAASSPFGSCSARTLFTVNGWATDGNEQFDYGAVKLNCNVGNTTGWFGFFSQTASLVGLPVQVSGYPGDKPFGTQWSGSGDVQISEARKTRYMIDTAGGQSGGPVFETDRVGDFCGGPCANTIHTYGLSNGRNSGTRIDEAVFNNLIAWINAP